MSLSDSDESIQVWKRCTRALEELLSPAKLRAGDHVSIAAMRIVHALTVAAVRGDLDVLREWENETRRYMLANAKTEYLRLGLAPRTGIDRKVILGGLHDQIGTVMQKEQAAVGEQSSVAFRIGLHTTFLIAEKIPDLKPGILHDHLAVQRVIEQLAKRYEKRVMTQRTVKPEEVLRDALRSFGLSRQEANDWLKRL